MSNHEPRIEFRLQRWLRWFAPLAMAVALVFTSSLRGQDEAPRSESSGKLTDGRVVVLIVDSLSRQNIDEGHMPWLAEQVSSGQGVRADITTCKANFTLPCVQTLFEGEESPFVSGLHNFTGKSGSGTSVPAMVAATGNELVLISNHTMNSLYGEFASRRFDSQEWSGDYRERDLRSYEQALVELDNPATSFLVTHTVGTDKTAHHKKPGSDAYFEHFEQMDDAVRRVASKLDPSRDFLLVTGDHGHDADGHHIQDSVTVFWGEGYRELIEGLGGPAEDLGQTDLRFFLSYPYGFPLPIDGDARFFEWKNGPPTSRYRQMAGAQSVLLEIDETPVVEALESERERRDADRDGPVRELLPLFLLGAFFVAWSFKVSREPQRSSWKVLVALAAVAPVLLLVSSPALGPLLALIGLGVWAWIAIKWDLGRESLTVLALLSAAALTSAFAREWSDFFHTRGGFRPPWLIFYFGMLPAALLTARGLLRRALMAPEAGMLAAVIYLPSGVYYYQAGQNFWTFFLIVGLFVAAWALRRNLVEKRKLLPFSGVDLLAIAMLGVGLVFVMLQEGGGWEWKFLPTFWMRYGWEGARYIVLAAGIAGSTLLFDSRNERLLILGLWGVLGFYAAGIADLPVERLASASVIVALALSYYRLAGSESSLRDLSDDSLVEFGVGVLTWIATAHVTWMLLDGFILNHVDFSFALDFFGQIKTESIVYATVQAAANLKYGFHIVLLCVGGRLLLGRERFSRAMSFAMAAAFFEVHALIVQAVFGKAYQDERLWELAISDILFVVNAAFMLPIVWLAVVAMEGAFGVVRARFSH